MTAESPGNGERGNHLLGRIAPSGATGQTFGSEPVS